MAHRSSSGLAGGSGANAAVPVPAGAAIGDIAVVGLYKESTAAVTPPSGFTQKVALTANVGSAGTLAVFWKRLTAADTGTYTFTWSGGTWRGAVCALNSGRVTTGDPFDGTVGTAESVAEVSTLNVSTSPATALGDAIGIWTNFNGGAQFSPPANYTERQDLAIITLDTRDGVAAGPTGDVTTSATVSAFEKAFLGVLKPASGSSATFTAETATGTAAAHEASFSGLTAGQFLANVATATAIALAAVLSPIPATFTAETATATASAHSAALSAPNGRYITAISGTHFVDQMGDPVLLKGDTVWSAPVNFGRWNGGDWQADADEYLTTRAAQGFNALYMALLGSVQNNGPSDTGETFDGVLPWVGGDIGTFNDTYWQRVDYILTVAANNGITVICDYAYSNDLNNAALSGATNAQFTDYGTSLGTRYAARPNLMWTIGGDYFGTWDSQLELVLAAIRAAGDTHLIGAQNYPETTSRQDLFTHAAQGFGVTNAQFNWVYTYNPTYDGIEQAWGETPQLPVVWGDGHYDMGSLNGGADRPLMRNLTWWALSSGARGTNLGTEVTWGWTSSGLASLATEPFGAIDLPAIRTAFEALPGWHLLLPDTDSSLVTAGRGTHVAPIQAPDEYNDTDPQDTWVSASVTPDGTLAVIYLPVETTITVDDTELVANYTATWIDPADGTTTPATVGTTYTNTNSNSLGDDDWVLVLQGLASVPADFDAEVAAATAAAAVATFTGEAAFTAAAATGTAASSAAVFTSEADLAATTATGTAASLSATYASEAVFSAATAEGTAAALTASLSAGTHIPASLDAGVATGTAAALSAAFTSTATFTAGVATGTAAAGEASFTAGGVGTLAALTAEATAAAHAAAFTSTGQATFQAEPATATAVALAPVFGGGTTFTAATATGTAAGHAPTFTVANQFPAATATGTAAALVAAFTTVGAVFTAETATGTATALAAALVYVPDVTPGGMTTSIRQASHMTATIREQTMRGSTDA